jgi:ubiquinone/menaquinone biosynthesis C-methylase UbiE
MHATDLRSDLDLASTIAQERPAPPRYDLSYRDVFWAVRDYEDRCDRIALQAMLPNESGHLLDLGAGFGRLVDEYHAFDRVTLVDASPTMTAAARERTDGDPRIDVLEADASCLPFASGSIDAVVAVRLLVHLGDPSAVFAEVARVLRSGGTFIVEFPNRAHVLARLRHLARLQRWSPRDPEPHEYLAGHFSHQPATIERSLRESGFADQAWRSVSLFRSDRLKARVPARVLARLEAPLQAPLGRLAFGPSVYVASRKRVGRVDVADVRSGA